jgi:hypothetical protein
MPARHTSLETVCFPKPICFSKQNQIRRLWSTKEGVGEASGQTAGSNFPKGSLFLKTGPAEETSFLRSVRILQRSAISPAARCFRWNLVLTCSPTPSFPTRRMAPLILRIFSPKNIWLDRPRPSLNRLDRPSWLCVLVPCLGRPCLCPCSYLRPFLPGSPSARAVTHLMRWLSVCQIER